ncbi:MAG TPA: PP2C family protein-serine/threonine phosphatase [Pyrinomonadaceae bacterium]|nr:PP2C family protein-serine/threonine phosphatase [Pyrinomonadaceae bacterium]
MSDRQIVQERREAELRVEHERTRAESERRARELEEARQLQLSMLPRRVPQLPDVEVAAYMRTASEIGGDYYDFHAGPENALLVVIGDATGHGLKAGTIVTATKSLFAAFAAAPRATTNVVCFLRDTSLALKAMNLRSLFMSLAVVVIKDGELFVAGAGMPPALLWRAADGSLEAVKLSGAPLGSVVSYPYREQRFNFAPGDVLFLMSDGCVERFNELGEMFDEERARDLLRRCAGLSPEAIIDRFVAAGEEWAGDRPPDDDITFVVLRRRIAPARSAK